jgi:hypothetical protein
MKKIFLTLIAAISVIIGVYAYPYDVRNGYVDIAEFDNITVSAPAKVRVVNADTFSINIMSKDLDILNSIKYDVHDGILNINADDNIEKTSVKTRIIITTPKKNLPEVLPGEGYEIVSTRTSK